MLIFVCVHIGACYILSIGDGCMCFCVALCLYVCLYVTVRQSLYMYA